MEEKFQFGVEFQYDLLSFTVNDELGFKALDLYEDSYFSLLEHQILAFILRGYYNKHKKIPIKSLAKEEFNTSLMRDRKYSSLLTKELRTEVLDLIDEIYGKPVLDGEAILEQVRKFASYIKFKSAVEDVNLENFEEYTGFLETVHAAIKLGKPEEFNQGQWLIEDIRNRQLERQISSPVFPTPFAQLNAITNAGGFIRGSILVVLDKPKNLKTYFLINLAKHYLRLKLNIFIADFENGMDELFLRTEQSISYKNKRDVLSGEYDKSIQKTLRKYRRLGGDIYIKRYPHRSKFRDIQVDFDEIYRTTGKRFHILILDYAALMSSSRKIVDETEEISEIYKEASDFAHKNSLIHTWSAHHIKREGESREATKYKDVDIAKCMDIVRHAQGIFGLNRSEEDKENNRLRLEVVAIRDGLPNGRCYFHTNVAEQRLKEFTKPELKMLSESVDMDNPKPLKKKTDL